MKSRIFTGILLILLLGSLLMPIYSIYPHMNLPAEVAEGFPTQVTGAELIFKGNAVLPLDAMPSLAALPFRQGLLAAGILLTLLGGLMSLTGRRWLVHTGVWTGFAGMLLLFLYAFYAQQLDKSMLFDVMINAKWFLWAVFAQSAALLGLDLWQMKRAEPIGVGTGAGG